MLVFDRFVQLVKSVFISSTADNQPQPKSTMNMDAAAAEDRLPSTSADEAVLVSETEAEEVQECIDMLIQRVTATVQAEPAEPVWLYEENQGSVSRLQTNPDISDLLELMLQRICDLQTREEVNHSTKIQEKDRNASRCLEGGHLMHVLDTMSPRSSSTRVDDGSTSESSELRHVSDGQQALSDTSIVDDTDGKTVKHGIRSHLCASVRPAEKCLAAG
ncbi:unnamed protein product [Soboliphyme baturini]|uniref:Fibrous sheath-interacting protein 1 n=1 Tax=Soboliphyme baturini TaxID=241478 RepID=A0A183IIQ2_9BILA|nr:unnamed protein product [Soboliphyme baturini]